MITRRQLNWLITAFFAVVVAIVFQQIFTSMTEQGIATGGPYDNGAAYPRAVAIVIGILVAAQVLIDNFTSPAAADKDAPISLASIRRPMLLLIIFGIYLGLLDTLGYHLTTAPMIFAVMWLCGSRQIWKIALAALAISFISAYVFENFLNIVLPGGIYHLNIPW